MTRICLLLLLAGAGLVGRADTVRFAATARGFGNVEVEARLDDDDSWTTFTCEDPAHARLVAAKRLADMLGFGDLRIVAARDLPGTALALDDDHYWLLAVDGNRFHEFHNRSARRLARAVDRAAGEGWQAVPAGAYPRWLDCFDNYGAGVWVGGGGDQYVLPDDFQWLSERRLAMCTLSPNQSRLVGPGLLDTTIFAWHSAIAKQYDIPYRVLFFPSDQEWLWNREPLPYVVPYPGYIAAPWLQYQVNAAGKAYEPVPVRDRYMFDGRRRLGEYLRDDPQYMGVHGCTEIPEAGVNLLAAVVETPGVKALWHGYLATELGMDLDTVSLLHRGDRYAYGSWDDVEPPRPQDFVGWDPATCIDLNGTWETHEDLERAGTEAAWFDPAKAPADWIPGQSNDIGILMYTPKRRRDVAEQPDFWMRRTVDVPADRVEQWRYLHIARSGYHGNPTVLFDAWLNGTKLECTSEARGDFDMCYVLGDALKAGANQLVLNTHGNPIPGYCFLGPVPLRRYPEMTPAENRRWYDGVNFDAWLRVRKIEGQLRASRTADPDRPLKMMATINLLDMTTRLCEQYGAYQHDTGGAGGYWCPMTGARLARSHGLPWSCEQGGPPRDVPGFQAAISRYVMYGNDALDMVFAVAHYRDKADVAAWFDENLELIRCLGKMHLPTPKIGVLRSTRATRMGFAEPWNWDVARGALQAAGRNFAYVEVPDIHDGIIDKFPVIIDCGTVLMTEADVQGILRYVRAGGIFVAQHHTGRHLPARADAWPLAHAVGLAVTPKWMSADNFNHWQLAKITVAEDQDLLPELRGQTIEGSGVAIDYLGQEHTGAVAYRAGNPDDRIRPVATWAEDGTMAVVDAHLGRGRLVMLGTPFYMRMRDVSGVWVNQADRNAIFAQFLTGLGVPRDSWTNDGALWAEIWRSKNGLFDLYPVCRNTTKGDDVLAGDVRLRRADKIAEVTEISALGHPRVKVSWKDGAFRLPTADYGLMRSRVFVAPRADVGRAALDWFRAQADIWRALPPVPAVRQPRPVPVPDDILPLTDGWTLSTPGQADRAVTIGAFATLGLPEDAVATFSCTVTVPPAWGKSPVTLVFDSEHWFWGILPHARLTVDGAEAPIKQPIVPQPLPSFSFDVSDAAADGTIQLVLEIDGTKPRDPNRQPKPNGVTGLFYLQAEPVPVQTTPVAGPWVAVDAYNQTRPLAVGERTKCSYVQTTFTVPADWPAARLFLAAPVHLGYVELNGAALMAPSWMQRLDVSRLVYRDGRENRLRWIPASRWVADRTRAADITLPELNLVWQQ